MNFILTLIEYNLTPTEMFYAINTILAKELSCGSVATSSGMERIKLSSRQLTDYDIWTMLHNPFVVNDKTFKISELATIDIQQEPQEVAKSNQQYYVCLQYEYIGSYQQGEKILNTELESLNKSLPMGYRAESESGHWRWNENDNKQYLLILLIIAIIFVTTSVLFNSLRQPFAIIFVIPISYIGVFLTFYLFGLNFNQGGFASFILLCGITVNASIYIISEYNDIRKAKPLLPSLKAYLKAWNAKIIPIFLTVISTILGFIPFMVGPKDSFWFPLAAGTIGGLVMSIVGIFIFLPLFTLKR